MFRARHSSTNLVTWTARPARAQGRHAKISILHLLRLSDRLSVLTDGQYELEFTEVSTSWRSPSWRISWMCLRVFCGILWKFRSPHVEYGSGAMKTAMPKGQNLADPKKAKRLTVKVIVDTHEAAQPHLSGEQRTSHLPQLFVCLAASCAQFHVRSNQLA